jgi:hypothetical protein
VLTVTPFATLAVQRRPRSAIAVNAAHLMLADGVFLLMVLALGLLARCPLGLHSNAVHSFSYAA